MPAPIIRKIGDLHRRIVLGAGSPPYQFNKDWSNRVISGDIRNLFDGDTSTFVEIDNDFNGGNVGDGKSWITFDFGKPRILDRIVLTNYAGNTSFSMFNKLSFWLPGEDIFNTPFQTTPFSCFNHNDTNPITEDLTTTITKEVRYIRLQLPDNGTCGGYYNTYSQNFKFAGLDIYEQFDTRDFSVEFNDSVLDLQGWKGPRYSGCKSIGKKINEYTPSSSIWQGDSTYGLKPNLENKTTALYISDTLIGGREDEQYADIAHHSYINISKILIIDLEDDTVRILDKINEPFEGFHRFITTDFPTGGKFSIKLIDEHVSNKLKDEYFVKMNKGWLLKSFSYSAGAGPLPGVDENGVNLKTTLGAPDGYRNSVANPLSLYDAVSGSIELAQVGDTGVIGQLGIPGITTAQAPFTVTNPHTFPGGHPYHSLGAGVLGTGVYGAKIFEDVNGDTYLESNLTGSPTLFDPVEDSYSYRFYGGWDEGSDLHPHGGSGNGSGTDTYTSSYEPTSVGELRFRYGVIQKIDDFAANIGDEARIFQPLYTGDNTEIIDNKFTRQFVDPTNNQQVKTRFFGLETIEEIEDRKTDLGQVATKDYKHWGKDKNFNPSITASVFIGNCVQHLNENSTNTELHLTLFEGTKDFSGLNDELSISTFEVDKNLDPSYLDFEENIGPLTKTIGPRSRYIRLKNQPQFKPTIPTASFKTTNFNTPGSPLISYHNTGRDRYVIDTIETDQFRCDISERQNSFVFGPGTTNSTLSPDCDIELATGYAASYDNSPANSQNFSGSFKYELSFLEKDHTIIADIDPITDLNEGIGGNGLVLMPEHTHEMVKINLEYYLEKAGLVNKTTVKKFINSND